MKTKSFTLMTAIFLATASFAQAATNELSSALQKGLFEEEANHNLEAAAHAYQSVATQFDKDRKVAATAIFRLGEVYRKQGKTNEANAQYERILREFADQTELVKLSQKFGTRTTSSKNVSGASQRLETLLVEAKSEYDENRILLSQLQELSREDLRKSIQTFFPDENLNALLERLSSQEQVLAILKDGRSDEHPELMRESQAIVDLLSRQVNEKIDRLLAGLKTKTAISQARVEALQIQLATASRF